MKDRLYFYWFDAIEDKASSLNMSGSSQKSSYTNVYMFGKVYNPQTNNTQNCCITVENIQRQIYVHPVQNVMKFTIN